MADKFWYQTVSGKIASNALQVGFHIPYNFAFFIGRLLINAHFTPFGWSSLPPFDVPETVFDWYVAGGALLLAGLVFASFKHEAI
ncbi:MAG: hypothetical protein O7G87_10520, partial [bacterium]|nr:hypothetical protein [bacterium]